MKKKLLLLFLATLTISCQSEEDKYLNKESQLIFSKAVLKIEGSYYDVNIDSFRVVYEKIKSEDAQIGLDFANRFKIYSNKLLQKRKEEELIINAVKTQQKEREVINTAKEKEVWENSKYGKFQKTHPNLTQEDCRNVIDKKIWIGMSLEILKYQRGRPDTANPSNYGEGDIWQLCWPSYSPSCFYVKNGIVTAYN